MKAKEIVRAAVSSAETVAVIGLGISGRAAAKFLARAGAKVIAIEKGTREKLCKDAVVIKELEELATLNVAVYFEKDGEEAGQLAEGAKLAVISPGVSLESAVAAALSRRGIPLIGELELALQLLGEKSVMVTGSNGKSTTVSLIHHIFKQAGRESFLCGNVGTPVISFVDPKVLSAPVDKSSPLLVVEVSSYQLESASTIHPTVAIWLNISDNHLERHGSLTRYIETKAKLFSNQNADDFAVVNVDDQALSLIQRSVRGKLCGIGRDLRRLEGKFHSIAHIEYDKRANLDKVNLKLQSGVESYELSSSKLIGLHNRYNIAASALAARLMGVSKEEVAAAINTFTPLTHRIEFVGEIAGNLVINDSKSTTVAATEAALSAVAEAYPERNLVLMIGGQSKAGSWEPLIKQVSKTKNFCGKVVCFGQDRKLLRSHFEEAGFETELAANVHDGLSAALKLCNGKNVILFSPGCASFDEFTSFENRGDVFKGLLQPLLDSRQ